MPYFKATIKACARQKLTLWDEIMFSAALISNFWEAKNETSGRCLLYLASKAVYGNGWIATFSIGLWRTFMQKLYPHGLQEVYGIYFGEGHPLAHYARKDFL
jgi:hypothetical protein